MAGERDSVGNQKHKRTTRGDAAEGRESLKAAALLVGRAISPFTVSPPDDRREKEERKMTGFIELTKAENGKKILLNVSKIEAVYPEEEGRGTFVSTESKSKREGKYYYGAFVKESYEEIKSKLEG